MDGVYRYQRHVYDLTRKYYLLGRDRLIDGLDVPPGGTVLELGCGTGRNLVRAARAYPDARFFGLDISAGMLETAAAPIAAQTPFGSHRAGARRRHRISTPQALFGQAGFDRVFISYALSMIPGWERTIPAALAALDARAARCTSSISAARSACRAGSARHCAPGSANSTSRRVIHCAKSWNRNASATGATLRFETLYRGYAVHAVVTRPA